MTEAPLMVFEFVLAQREYAGHALFGPDAQRRGARKWGRRAIAGLVALLMILPLFLFLGWRPQAHELFLHTVLPFLVLWVPATAVLGALLNRVLEPDTWAGAMNEYSRSSFLRQPRRCTLRQRWLELEVLGVGDYAVDRVLYAAVQEVNRREGCLYLRLEDGTQLALPERAFGGAERVAWFEELLRRTRQGGIPGPGDVPDAPEDGAAPAPLWDSRYRRTREDYHSWLAQAPWTEDLRHRHLLMTLVYCGLVALFWLLALTGLLIWWLAALIAVGGWLAAALVLGSRWSPARWRRRLARETEARYKSNELREWMRPRRLRLYADSLVVEGAAFGAAMRRHAALTALAEVGEWPGLTLLRLVDGSFFVLPDAALGTPEERRRLLDHIRAGMAAPMG